MNLITEHNKKYEFFRVITGEAMRVYNKFHAGLLESAYEAALKYLLEQQGHKVERQVYLPIFWDEVPLDQSYRLDLVIGGNIICELKAVQFVGMEHRRQLENYMRLTHAEYGMLINFGSAKLYSEWYRRDPVTGWIEQVKMI